MKIEILGMGCKKCSDLMEGAKKAAAELNVEAEFVKVEDIKKIMSYGVMTTPALVVDGVVKVSGKIPSVEEIKALLR
ncbi:thioredoxin family protein [Pelosinus sp. sgz500959]|uniref:thioredoxin family protein n=1 Tax=Pelosinus sp. sgz500959 TaxID=3242472 RepID=UPI00366C1E52